MMMTEQMLDKLLDDAIDAQFMKRGFKASAMRQAVLKTLEDNNLHIVAKEVQDET